MGKRKGWREKTIVLLGSAFFSGFSLITGFPALLFLAALVLVIYHASVTANEVREDADFVKT